MRPRGESFNLVSIIDLMFSFTGILLFLIWGFSSIPREKQYRKAKEAVKEYYSFVLKKAQLTTVKARRDFIFQLKPMVFILDSGKTLKYLSPEGYPEKIAFSEMIGKIKKCVRINKSSGYRKRLCGVVFMIPPEGFAAVKEVEKKVWNFLENTEYFLPLSYIPMDEETYRKARALWEK